MAMHALVISENKLSSGLLCSNLQCENIISENKSIFENYEQELFYKDYDCIIIKLTLNNSLNKKILKFLNEINYSKPVFLLINKYQNAETDLLKLTTKYIYPNDIPTRYLAYEIKKILNKKFIIKNESIIKVFDIVLNTNRRVVERFGQKHFLRNKEFQLLEFLMRNKDTLLSRQLILENVWDRNAYFITNTVDVHINSLRKKIDNIEKYKLIETVYCSGYILHSKPFTSTNTITTK
jgi:DNA-binding response OmpR family regulator